MTVITIMITYGCLYFIYFQWNILCIYKMGKSTLPLSKQILCQKGSEILMCIMLLVHFILYVKFIEELLV